MRRERQQIFHKAVMEAWKRHGFKSYRQAEVITGINYTALYNMQGLGRIPSRSKVIEWAEGIGEPINKWLELADYEPLPTELVKNEDGTVRVAKMHGAEFYLRMEKGAEVDEEMLKAIREVIKKYEAQDHTE